MGSDEVLARIIRHPHLPSPPAIALQVINLTNQPTCSLRDLAKLLLCDPSMCGKFLGLVNSSLFAGTQPTSSIDRALQFLGLKRVRTLVLSLALTALRFRSANEAWLKTYWKSAIGQAISARQLAGRLHRPDPDADMLAGLLCDMGVLFLQETHPELYRKVLERSPDHLAADLCAVEETLIGVNHCTVSAAVLASWGLPQEITAAIRQHHAPETGPDPIATRARILYFAGRVARLATGRTNPQAIAEITSLAIDPHGMNEQALTEFLDSLHNRIGEFATLIDMDLGPSESLARLYASGTEHLAKLAIEMSIDNLRAEEKKAEAERSLKDAESALQKQESHLRQGQKMEAIGRLAGGVAHDFNNLLTIINGYSQLLLGTLDTGHPGHSLAQEIHKAGERAAGLTRQLLAFSRKQVLHPHVLSVNSLLGDMESLLRRLAGDHVELTLRLGRGLKNVKADPSQLEQVLMNLVVNARDAIPSGGKVTIETQALAIEKPLTENGSVILPGPFVQITVSDSGVGMDPATLAQLFEPFFTTKEFGKGTGLGLAVVHGIIKQSGGYIRVASEVGKGSTFRIFLPGVDESVAPTSPVEPLSIPVMDKRTVILAEDEDAVRSLARLTLEQCGFKTLAARDGPEALQICQTFVDPIDLLVTDIVMPSMSGLELARELTRQRPAIKVLFTSGYTDDSVLQTDPAHRGAGFIQKPYTPRDLASKVRMVLA